jgi:hypothetical protein
VRLDPRDIGRAYAPIEPYSIARLTIRELADPVRDPNVSYRDPTVARSVGYRDVIARPTYFCTAPSTLVARRPNL